MNLIVRYIIIRLSFSGTAATIIVLVTFFSTAFAQSDTTRRLDEIKVLASPVPFVKSITPAQQITASDFKRYSAYNVADAIRNFSGVNIKDYGGIGGLKTVSVRSLGANHTAVQLDGIQISDSQNGQVDLGKINLDNVESILLYNGQPSDIVMPARSFASASLLVIKSVKPKLEPSKPYEINAGFKTGSFGLVNPSVQWQQRINKNWSFNFTNSLQKADGEYKYKVDGDGSDTLAIRQNANFNMVRSDAQVFWSPNDSLKFNVRANFNNADQGLPGAVVFYHSYSNQRLHSREIFVQSSLDKKWSTLQLLVNAKYARNYNRYVDPDYLNTAGYLDQRYTQQEFYGSGVLAYKPLEKLTFAYASDFARSTLATNLYSYSYPKRYTYLNAFSTDLKAGRFQIQGTLLSTIIHEVIETGVAAANRNVFSPSITASYQPSAQSPLLIRAFFKDIFRNPTFNDLYYTRIGNRSLKPETARQYNLGITYSKSFNRILDYLTLSTDIYYNNVRDKIIAIPNKDLFTWSMLNLGEVDIRGIDFGAKSQFKLNTSLAAVISGNYTFQQAVDVTERGSSVYLNQIPYTPQHTFSANIGINASNWGIFYNQIYSSSRYYMSENLPEYYVPGFMVSDLSVKYRFTGGKFPITLSTEINNVFNTSYVFIRSFPMPGRSVRISFQITI